MQPDPTIAPHTPVAVHCRYDGSWTEGFEVAEAEPMSPAPYVLRRLSDGIRLPSRFRATEVRQSSFPSNRPPASPWERFGPHDRHDD